MKRLISLFGILFLPYLTHAQVLVVAPHPDDETLAAAEMIQKKIQNGVEVHVVYVTDGEAHVDGAYMTNAQYGNTRRQEALDTFAQMGGKIENAYFLGFPDGFLNQMNGKEVKSSFTGRTRTPHWSYYADEPYSLTSLEHNLEKIVRKVTPKKVLYTSPTDKHPDHATVGHVMRRVLQFNPTVGYEYTIHQNLGQKDRWRGYDPHPKLQFIRNYHSQFHTPYHQYYLETFAYFPERFQLYLPRF